MFQGPKGYIAQMCEVHLQYGNSATKINGRFRLFSSKFHSNIFYSLWVLSNYYFIVFILILVDIIDNIFYVRIMSQKLAPKWQFNTFFDLIPLYLFSFYISQWSNHNNSFKILRQKSRKMINLPIVALNCEYVKKNLRVLVDPALYGVLSRYCLSCNS